MCFTSPRQQNAIYERSLVLERRTLEVQNLLIPVDETFDPAEPCSICQDNLLTSEPADSGAEKTKEGSLQAPSGLSCAKVVVRLRCNHYFHSTCIKAWLVSWHDEKPGVVGFDLVVCWKVLEKDVTGLMCRLDKRQAHTLKHTIEHSLGYIYIWEVCQSLNGTALLLLLS